MTLTDLLAAVSADCGYDAIPSAVVTARLTRYVNDAYRQLLSMPEFGPLRLSTVTFTSLANVKSYGLPQTLVAVDQMVDTASAIRLRLMTTDEFRTIDPQENASGTPTHYVPIGYHPLYRDPNMTALYVISVNGADTTQTVTMTSVRNVDNIDTDVHTATVTLNGTTPVLVDTFVVAVHDWHLSAPALGSVQLYDSIVAANARDALHRFAAIQNPNLTVQYLGIRLWPTPSDARVYQVDGDLGMADLSTTNPFPVIPVDFQDILADAARMREFEYRDDSRFPMAQAAYQEKLKQLRNRVCFPPDCRPRVQKLGVRGNNLDHDGVNFPAGRF